MGGLVDSSATGTLICVSGGIGPDGPGPLQSQVGPSENPVVAWGQNPKYFRFCPTGALGHRVQSHRRFM